MYVETALEKDWRINGACKFSHICFLNCHGCARVDFANAEELRQARKDLKEYRKKYLIKP